MQPPVSVSVSDDDVQKRLLERPRSELAAKRVFRLGRCYAFRHGVLGIWVGNRQSMAIEG